MEAVFFDLDGTLHDRLSSVRALAISQYERFEELQTLSLETYLGRFFELDQRGYVSKAETYPILVASLGLSSELGPLLAADYRTRYNQYAQGFPGMAKLLIDLRSQGLLLGIVTNGPIEMQIGKVRALDLERLVDDVLVSQMVGVKKPDPQIYQAALKRLGVPAEQSVFVGDHPENDISGPQAAGMKAIWFRDDFWGEAITANASTVNLLEIPELIRNI